MANDETRVRNAKEVAVREYLMAAGARGRPPLAAYALSTHPADNVVGVGIGRKLINGGATGPYCLRLFVEHKLPREVLRPEELLPGEIGGIPTDVIETGRFVASRAKVPGGRRRRRPIQPGCSIGFQYTGRRASWRMAGTLGALVEKNGTLCILSNNHVLAQENLLPPGSSIFQPALLDGGIPHHDAVAQLAEFVELSATEANEMDCALAQILDPSAVRLTFLPKVGRLRSGEPTTPSEDAAVEKVGRTTGYTTGVIFETQADVRVQYVELGNLLFRDQVLIVGEKRRFSDEGDSGSVIVERATKRPTALLFAGSAQYAVATALERVLAKLGTTVRIR